MLFLFSLVIILFSAYLTASVAVKDSVKKNTGFLYILISAFAQVVLSFEILSLFGSMRQIPFIVLNCIILCIVSGVWIKNKCPIYDMSLKTEFNGIKKALNRDKLLKFLSFCFVVYIISQILVIVLYPVNFGDALNYYLTRCTSWLYNGNINHFNTFDSRELIMPVNMEFLYCWHLMFFKTEHGTGIYSFISFIGALYVIYNFLGELGFCRRKRLWSLFVFSSFAVISIMATTPCADVFIGALLLCGIYLFYVSLKYGNKIAMYYSALSIALSFGTKTTAIIAFPSVFIILFVLASTIKLPEGGNEKQGGIRIIFNYIFLLFINFMIFSSYNYILNVIEFHNPISCSEQFLLNKFRGGIKGYLTNVVKYCFSVFDMSGISNIQFYNDFINKAEGKIFALAGGTRESFTSPFFQGYFEYDSNITPASCVLGAMGLFAFSPAVFIAIYKGINNRLKNPKCLILFLSAASLIFNVLLFSRVMVFTEFNMRYIVTFFVIASPVVVLTYIKSFKNIFKWFLSFIMFVYLFLIAHIAPASFIIIYTKYLVSHWGEKDIYEKITNIVRDEYKIYKFLSKSGQPVSMALIHNSKDTALSDIEKLRLKGYRIDKITLEDLENFDLSKYDYIYTGDFKAASSYIKKFREFQSGENFITICAYYDYNKNFIKRTDNKKPVQVDCVIPFNLIRGLGFEEIRELNLIESKLFVNTRRMKN